MNFVYKDFKVTENFWFHELIKTNCRISNYPSDSLTLFNLFESARKLQNLRDGLFRGKPITINSGYRSTLVNRAVGGVPTSDHVKGLAFDIIVSGFESTPYDLFINLHNYSKIEKDLFGQVICYSTFVHVSFNREKHKNEFICKDLF